ncbi:hypothetical protein IQ22_01810 [Pseudomonas duriflava]|uniref:TIGR01777 family protein n=1 Tax=Pseudomonas duriflava TaxID=459528 RepID=A0A562QFU8_9PSED|nr:TIGR01777 family oxidoreductase [Pseudomonas duriflava]TWI54906.1 hypothetical protein IQ22_01810 [Pseudomonas duriflava]
MHILLTGGTGLIGRALCRHWLEKGYRLTVLSRSPDKVAHECGPGVRGVDTLDMLNDEPLDAVINLAGAPIADRPWTSSRKAELWRSRIGTTERLVEWLAEREQKPRVLISGSAIGWYGDTREKPVVEYGATPGDDFASELCLAWEQVAMEAKTQGIRVITIRTGLVLAADDGFLLRLLPLFRMGLGGRLGSGKQWMPWIHLKDQIEAMDFLLERDEAQGPYNLCSPQPVRNAEFAQSLGRALHRPARVPVPSFALRLMGELSVLLLGGQRALPQRLQEAGYTFRFTDLDAALDDLLRIKDHS